MALGYCVNRDKKEGLVFTPVIVLAVMADKGGSIAERVEEAGIN